MIVVFEQQKFMGFLILDVFNELTLAI